AGFAELSPQRGRRKRRKPHRGTAGARLDSGSSCAASSPTLRRPARENSPFWIWVPHHRRIFRTSRNWVCAFLRKTFCERQKILITWFGRKTVLSSSVRKSFWP